VTAGTETERGDKGASTGSVERLLNRELSWLDFNARVLELAADRSLPLLERVKFCAIFASNLDEFFSVRVGGLMEQRASGITVRSPDGRTPREALTEIRERVLTMTAALDKLWRSELRPALAEQGIVIGRIGDCTEKELAELAERFEREIYPVLTPLAVGPGQPFPFISPLSLSLGIFVRDPKSGEERFARVKVPELLPRFIQVGRKGTFLALEHVIAHSLSALFPKMEIVECSAFRVTRDADFEVSDEADDLLEAVELELQRRRFGGTVRIEVSASMSDEMLAQLKLGLGVDDEQIYPVDGKLDLADLQQIADLDRPDLKHDPWRPVTQPRLSVVDDGPSLFAEIARGDLLVHLPYESFGSSVEAFVRYAADDPNVIAIKTTVYRTSDESAIVPSLIAAAEAGKQTVCLVELKARFDEHRNIEWSRAMEQSGVHVVYGFPNVKIHAKATLVVRREPGGLRRYVHVGTGNYHALTARLYEDFGLFTADESIASDVADLFNHLTGFGRPQRFRRLLVAPFALRTRLIDEIRSVAQAAAGGKDARIRLKVNALTDEAIIEELYDASQAGAEIDIVTRSICSLRPGEPGLSDNIRVRSIVGRFLEHSRVFIFEAGSKSTYLIGSADLMPRNLDNRLEIVAPVEDGRARQKLAAAFEALINDNADAWQLRPDGTWRRVRTKKDARPLPAQTVLMRTAIARARRTVSRRT
jgi:polyphosphate kinase